MPTATQTPSGRSGCPANRRGGNGSNVLCVGIGGVGNLVGEGTAIVTGAGQSFAVANQTGPNEPIYIHFAVNNLRRVPLGYNFTVNGTIPVGVTKDSTGTPLGGCRVDLFETGSNLFHGTTTSDGSGNYSFAVDSNSSTYYVRAYLAGSPNRFGTTDEILVAV